MIIAARLVLFVRPLPERALAERPRRLHVVVVVGREVDDAALARRAAARARAVAAGAARRHGRRRARVGLAVALMGEILPLPRVIVERHDPPPAARAFGVDLRTAPSRVSRVVTTIVVVV